MKRTVICTGTETVSESDRKQCSVLTFYYVTGESFNFVTQGWRKQNLRLWGHGYLEAVSAVNEQ